MTKNPIDKLGLAISDAGYKWTPKMKAAYNESIRERERFIESINLMFNALIETSNTALRTSTDVMHCANISGNAYMNVRDLKIDGSTLWDKYAEERKKA